MLNIPLGTRLTILAVVLTGFIFAFPNLFYERVEAHNDAVVEIERQGEVTEALAAARDGWPGWLPATLVNLGLDLRGGAYLLVEVALADVYERRIDALWPEVRDTLGDLRGTIGPVRRVDSAPGELRVRIGRPEAMATAIDAVEELGEPVVSLTGSVGQSTLAVRGEGDQLVVTLSEAERAATDNRTMQQAVEIVRRRIDEAGTREPSIQRQGRDRIIVQVPGVASAQDVLDLIGTTALLSFHPVVQITDDPEATVTARQVLLPSAEQEGVFYVLEATPVVTGEELVDAQPSFDQQTGQPSVTFRFNPSGAQAFGDFTAANLYAPFAIVLDDEVISAPEIQSAIRGGSGQITGNFTVEEATDLAILLRAGALPAELAVLEQRTVGPQLGADSVQAGQIAAAVAFVAVLVFMILGYGRFGIFASLALLVNLSLVLGVLSALGATLTLPGIAGIVLTIGMAVDANVLVFERIREEVRTARGPSRAIELGYERALSAIIDANITTFIVAVILFVLGSGPVRGFAVTLGIGILTSIFTAVFVTRLLIVLWFERRRPKKIEV